MGILLLFKITMPKARYSTDHAMYFQWLQSIMIFWLSKSIFGATREERVRHPTCFWFKDIGNGQKILGFSCSFAERSCCIRSDSNSIYHRRNIYQVSQSLYCLRYATPLVCRQSPHCRRKTLVQWRDPKPAWPAQAVSYITRPVIDDERIYSES